jgi:hypothetical protein
MSIWPRGQGVKKVRAGPSSDVQSVKFIVIAKKVNHDSCERGG